MVGVVGPRPFRIPKRRESGHCAARVLTLRACPRHQPWPPAGYMPQWGIPVAEVRRVGTRRWVRRSWRRSDLLNEAIRTYEHGGRRSEPESPRSAHVERQRDSVDLFDRRRARIGPLEELVHELRQRFEVFGEAGSVPHEPAGLDELRPAAVLSCWVVEERYSLRWLRLDPGSIGGPGERTANCAKHYPGNTLGALSARNRWRPNTDLDGTGPAGCPGAPCPLPQWRFCVNLSQNRMASSIHPSALVPVPSPKP